MSAKWFEPDVEDLRKQMRYAYENKDKMKEMGKNALNIANNFTWHNAIEALLKAIKY